MRFRIKNAISLVKHCYNTFKEMNNSNVKKLQMCGSEEEMREIVAKICRNYLHGAWKTIEPGELEFRKINGGLSNFLYYVALPEDTRLMLNYGAPVDSNQDPDEEPPMRTNSFSLEEPKRVLIRIYGQVHGERAMDAIVTESVIFTLLSERRLGPKLHGVFSGGRIEEYIPARPLQTKELSEPALSMKIAEKMAGIHTMEIPLSKEPTFIWKSMGKWLKLIKEESLLSKAKATETQQQCVKYLKSIDFDKEIEWLKKYLSTVESPVVFCHNDMQEGNILLVEESLMQEASDDVTGEATDYHDAYSLFEAPKSSKENNHTLGNSPRSSYIQQLPPFDEGNTSDSHISDNGEPKLVLIDFEYCAYNHRGFDIANHFQEWTYDYTNSEYPFYFENRDHAPTLAQKEIFIKEYLKHFYANTCDDKQHVEVTIFAVNKLLDEVESFTLASNLFWCLWSIVNASKSQIPFGYWEHAVSRLENYKRFKQEVIKKDKCQKRKICEVDI